MLPDIYYFNPTCELSIANGSPYYTAPSRLRKFEEDLSSLPVWLGRENDLVLVKGAVDEQFCNRLRRLGFKLATPVRLADVLTDPLWLSQPIERLLPWGWSPAAYQLFQPLMPLAGIKFKESAVAGWEPGHKLLYSRLTGIALLSTILSNSGCSWLPDLSVIPVACDSLETIYVMIDKFKRAVVKTPWSSSGRGLLFFPNVDSVKKNEEVLRGMLNQQGFVTVEPWLQKVMDLSYQFQSYGGEIRYMGRTIFETDEKGRYLRNLLADRVAKEDEINTFLEENNGEVISLLGSALAASGYARLYEGWIGVDALIYRTGEGKLKFQPVIEINGRFTMGAISLKIRDYLAEGSSGFLQIFYSRNSSFYDFCREMEGEKPLIMKDHKIVCGFLPLTPPLKEHHFGAYAEVMSYK